MPRAASFDALTMQAWVRAQQLPTGGLIRESTDPEQLAQEISLIANLKSFDSLIAPRHFLHRSSILLLGDIAVTSAAFMPQCGETTHSSQALIELPLHAGGHTTFLTQGKHWDCIPGQQGLFLPGDGMAALTEQPACILGYNVEPNYLAMLLEQMAPERFSERTARLFVQQPHRIRLRDPRVKTVTDWLLSFLQTMGGRQTSQVITSSLLLSSYEQMVYRATAMLLCPELTPGFSGGSAGDR
jgi:hypothetical protein